MRNQIEDNSMIGTDEEFQRRLREFYRSCYEWGRSILRMTIRSPCNCWYFIQSLPGHIKDKYLRQYIAMTVLLLSFLSLCAAIVFLSTIPIIYSVTFFVCSAVSLYFQKGYAAYADNDEILEQKRLLDHFSSQKVQADQPARDGAKNKKQSSLRSLEDIMEPRRGSGAGLAARGAYQVPYDFHGSDMHAPLNNNDDLPNPLPRLIYGENSAGTSSTPDPFPPLNYDTFADESCTSADVHHKSDASRTSAAASRISAEASCASNEVSRTSDPSPSCKSASKYATSCSSFEDITTSFVTSTQFGEESYDSEEPLGRLTPARLSAHAVKAFGAPAQVFGADSYSILLSSDEHCSTMESSPDSSEVHKTFEVSVEVHRDSRSPINSSNDGSSSVEPASMTSDESSQMAGSDLYSNIPYMDDEHSSESNYSTPLDEESIKTEDS